MSKAYTNKGFQNPPALRVRMVDARSRDLAGASVESTSSRFGIGGFGPWDLVLPRTVYPPREDTDLLGRALLRLSSQTGTACEIGCGSGAISMLLASMGWEVSACDVNPFAVAATRGNLERAGLGDVVSVEEGGPGEPGWRLPRGVSLVVWNLPYLNPPDLGAPVLEPIEEASFSDDPEGWSNLLMDIMDGGSINPECLVVLLHRTDPDSPSMPLGWTGEGWSCRRLDGMRVGDERLEVMCYWKPAAGESPTVLEQCESTMDEVGRLSGDGWGRVLAHSQASGRGRGGSSWETMEGGLACTWILPRSCLDRHTPGLIQTAIGAAVSDVLRCDAKWPNDLVSSDGRKLGGVLMEVSSEDRFIRAGIGLNRRGGDVGGVPVAGWEEFIGAKSAMRIFGMIDACISSLFEEHPLVPCVSDGELVALSWRALSKSLSRGVDTSLEEESVRVVGLSEEGHLLVESAGQQREVGAVGGLTWAPIDGA